MYPPEAVPPPPVLPLVDWSDAAPAPVLLAGAPGLAQVARPVPRPATAELRAQAARLVATLEEFRSTHGFGRGIAAPQIGVSLRLLALDLGSGPFVLCDPVITRRSPETFTMWDDCMSFPQLLVRVRRHVSIDLEYSGLDGRRHLWPRLEQPHAELLQHEVDHLDGILALERADGPGAVVTREAFEQDREGHEARVDYVIAPTIGAAGTGPAQQGAPSVGGPGGHA